MTGVGEDMEELGPSYTAGGNVKLCSHCGKPLTVTQKVEHCYHYNLAIPLLGVYSRALKTYVHTKTCTQMFIALLLVAKK